MAVAFNKPKDDDIPWQQRLVNYSNNPDDGRTEYQRALQVYNAKTALGDTTGASAAQRWMDQVNKATGGYASRQDQPGNQYREQISPLIEQLTQRAQAEPFQFQAPQPFHYNPQADPQYQAALRQAQQNAQTASGNAMVQLGSRGIGNSSMTGDRVAQIQQRELGRVSDTVLPQLMQQAYSRYADEANRDYQMQLANYQAQQAQQDRLASLIPMMSGLDQQDLRNEMDIAGLTGQFRGGSTLEQRQANLGALERAAALTGQIPADGPKSDWRLLFEGGRGGDFIDTAQQANYEQQFEYQQLRDQIADEQYKQKFDEDVRRWGIEHAANEAYRQGQLSISQMNAATSRMNANRAASESQMRQRQTEDARGFQAQVMDGLSQFDDPNEANAWLRANAGEITRQLGADGYANLQRMTGSFYGQPEQVADDSALRQRAIDMASKDMRWMDSGLDTNGRNQIIQEYMSLLRGR